MSIATVSYVLNGSTKHTIPDSTRERVRQAANALGYVPHGVARALREGMSRIVLLNVGSMLGGHSLDSFISGMSEELRAQGHALLVAANPDTNRGAVPNEAVEALAPRAVLDLAHLLTGAADEHPLFGVAEGHQTGLGFHTLTQLRHLAEAGHREIAFAIPLDPRASFANSRIEHVASIAAELGMGPVHTLVLDMDATPSERVDTLRSFLDRAPVTAVAAYSDDVAFCVLSAMAGLGLHAPHDLAVIGFDDGRHGQFWRPTLTTVRIDAASFGRRAARIALDLDPGEWVQPPSEVIVRESA